MSLQEGTILFDTDLLVSIDFGDNTKSAHIKKHPRGNNMFRFEIEMIARRKI